VLCVQLLGEGMLKAQYFPGKSAKDVPGFTPLACLYMR
jgi:hypothetical protein